MKKVIVLIAAVIVLAALVFGGSRLLKKQCEVCHESGYCKEYTVTLNGKSEDGFICGKCIDEYRERYENMGGTVVKK